jgi:hypothetical protein
MRRLTAAAAIVTASCLAFATPLAAQAPAADPADVASPQALVDAAYAAIARAPGQKYDWTRFRTLFLEEARLIPNLEQSDGTFTVLSPQDFIDWIDGVTVVGGESDRGFREVGVHNVVEEYGDIAHVFSTYQKHYWNDEQVLGGGINSFQMVRKDGRWWITGIIWDEPSGAGPIPEKYQGR